MRVKSPENFTAVACAVATSPYTVATLPWEIQNCHVSTVSFIHTSDYLSYLRRKQTVRPLPTTSEKCHRTTL